METRTGPTTGATILVVDDMVSNVDLIEAHLVGQGYRVERAFDGDEAIDRVKAVHPDLVLMDVMMPHMDGFTACGLLKADPETALLPVVMITSLKGQNDLIRSIEVGADDFITKPFSQEELFARVKSLLRIRALTQELAEERANRARAELIGQVAVTLGHEVNNPLTAVLGFTRELMARTPNGSPEHGMLEHIRVGAERIREIVAKIRAVKDPRVVQYYKDTYMLDLNAEDAGQGKA